MTLETGTPPAQVANFPEQPFGAPGNIRGSYDVIERFIQGETRSDTQYSVSIPSRSVHSLRQYIDFQLRLIDLLKVHNGSSLLVKLSQNGDMEKLRDKLKVNTSVNHSELRTLGLTAYLCGVRGEHSDGIRAYLRLESDFVRQGGEPNPDITSFLQRKLGELNGE